MAVALTKGYLDELKNRWEGMKKKVAKLKEESGAITEELVDTGVATGTAFLVGYAEGKYDGVKILKMQLPFAYGVAAKIAGISGLAGKYSHLLKSSGTGSLSLYTGTIGRDFGARSRADAQKALQGKSGTVAGDLSTGSGGENLHDAEMERLANAR